MKWIGSMVSKYFLVLTFCFTLLTRRILMPICFLVLATLDRPHGHSNTVLYNSLCSLVIHFRKTADITLRRSHVFRCFFFVLRICMQTRYKTGNTVYAKPKSCIVQEYRSNDGSNEHSWKYAYAIHVVLRRYASSARIVHKYPKT